MASPTLKTLFAAALAASGVRAGPCKPSLGTSSIISFLSSFSSVGTQSSTDTTDILSTATNTKFTTDVLSTTETHSTTDTPSTTVFESTASTETTSAADTTSTVCIPTCSQGQQAVLKNTFPDQNGCGRQVAPWGLKDSFKIGPDKDIPFSECANECASNCHCKSFVWYNTCSLFSGTYAQMNPGDFYLGPPFYDVEACFKCEEPQSTAGAQSTTETITTAEAESTTTDIQSSTDAQLTTVF
ncbi:hypothetical protein F53441_476 [Fusarium austroafricanum]|uniref:Apple domain-containing protein n=1 Tax=Fusarium austroafricanum TaxID=2364996 RepID=A0A8H4KYA1_9HYPO|nr:hypothetical protein F53441_476 [Fusarium austroafricanum]